MDRAGSVGIALLLAALAACHTSPPGPTDEQLVAGVRKSPPSPPTPVPTYLAQIDSVEVQERGAYNADGKYWPVRVRVKGATKVKPTNVFQIALMGDPAKQKASPVEFVEEARLTKDDFGSWRISYIYDSRGPRWRLDERQMQPGRSGPGE